MTKTEAKEIISNLYDELEARWEQSALRREEQHEHYGPCYECEEEYEAMLQAYGICDLERSLRYLPTETNQPGFLEGTIIATDEIEEW